MYSFCRKDESYTNGRRETAALKRRVCVEFARSFRAESRAGRPSGIATTTRRLLYFHKIEQHVFCVCPGLVCFAIDTGSRLLRTPPSRRPHNAPCTSTSTRFHVVTFGSGGRERRRRYEPKHTSRNTGRVVARRPIRNTCVIFTTFRQLYCCLFFSPSQTFARARVIIPVFLMCTRVRQTLGIA